MPMFDMYYYVIPTKDGLVHVQNAIGWHLGQHHVHTPEDFKVWKKDAKASQIVELRNRRCSCGLKAGEVKNGM